MLDINKKTLNSDFSCIDNEQLFAQLTPEEGAVIEGGGFLLIEQVQAITANADTFGADQTYITVNGSKLWAGDLYSGQTAGVNRGLGVGFPTNIDLFDTDDGLFDGGDDYLGGFTVNGPTNGTAITRVSGSGSTYDVYYRVFS